MYSSRPELGFSLTPPLKYSIMQMKNIVLLDDLFRQDFIEARRFIYGLIREPLKQIGFDFPKLENFPKERGLPREFSLDHFHSLCKQTSWLKNYHAITKEAGDYLIEQLPKESIVIGYEMPPWLLDTLDASNHPRVDIRISPERFAKDLYLSISTTLKSSRITEHQVTENAIRLEAGIMKASILHHAETRKISQQLQDSVIIIGQTSADASRVKEAGELAHFMDYSQEIKQYIGSRNIFYKPHPYDSEATHTDISALEYITGKKVQKCSTNAYYLLCNLSNTKILTLSSGVAQESAFFDRDAKALFTPWFYRKDLNPAYGRITPSDFLAPAFWAAVCNISGNFENSSPTQRNQLRELHNTWWGFADYQIKTNSFWEIAFTHFNRRKKKGLLKKLKDRLKKQKGL